jgi:hypothetical protein
MSVQARTRSLLSFAIVLAGFFCSILLLAHYTELTFPLPNEDDARFFLPSWELAVHGDLRPSILNATEGLYWVPHGFYLVLAFFLHLFGPTISIARTVVQAMTALAVVILTLGHARLCRSRSFAALSSILLISPSVIFTANTIRMESLVFLLYALAVLLHAYERRVAAASVLALSLIVHPALAFGTVVYAGSVAASAFFYPDAGTGTHGRLRTKGWEWLVLALVAFALLWESVVILEHLQLFRLHMAYQVQRKAHRSLFSLLFRLRGLFFVGECAIFTLMVLSIRRTYAAMPFVREVLPLALVALSLQAYSAVGAETSYNVYSFAIVPATFFCLLYQLHLERFAAFHEEAKWMPCLEACQVVGKTGAASTPVAPCSGSPRGITEVVDTTPPESWNEQEP